ncbi:MAG TPA: hypothetical protein PK812_12625 [Beijerinckiaceae bacterium]|nr:hypothetical protein [Beijerinckiaceae bacterium]
MLFRSSNAALFRGGTGDDPGAMMLEVELLELTHPLWATAFAALKPSRWLPQSLMASINSLRHDRAILAQPDRRHLEQEIVPYLGRTGARDVLFVGTRSYTTHYPALFEQAGMTLWTTDIDPFAARYGVAGRHVTIDATHLTPETFGRRFDAVVFSGVIGFGLDSDVQISRAASALSQLITNDGVLVLGWNSDRSADPLDNPVWRRLFRRSTRAGAVGRTSFRTCTHVFDVLEADPEA